MLRWKSVSPFGFQQLRPFLQPLVQQRAEFAGVDRANFRFIFILWVEKLYDRLFLVNLKRTSVSAGRVLFYFARKNIVENFEVVLGKCGEIIYDKRVKRRKLCIFKDDG